MMNWIISSSILILIIITIRHFLKGKMSLRLQYGLWLIVAVRLLIPFSIGEAVTSVSTWLDLVGDRQAVQEIVDFTQTPIRDMVYEETYFDSVPESNGVQGDGIETLPDDDISGKVEYEIPEQMGLYFTPAEVATFLWKLGMVLVGAWFLFSNIHFSLKLRKDRVLYGEKGRLKVYQTSVVETPCLYGLFTPAIYVTKEVVGDETRMQHVLEHEMTHYRHGDYIWALVRVLCLTVHWYNPLVWCAALLSRRDAELACDEATIKRLGEEERASYGRTLIGLTCEKRPAVLITATTMTGSKRSIKERIKLIAQKPKMAVITLVVVIVLIITAIGWTFAGAKPPYESFSEWADTLNADDFKSFHLSNGFGKDEIRYQATKEDFEEFLELLKAVPEEKCYRRDQSAEIYEEYYMAFLVADAELLLKCLDDKTLLCIWADYMPEFVPEGRELVIDSPEIWNYIVDTVKEKGTVDGQETDGNSNTENNQTTEEQPVVENVHYEMTADLNHDGIDDLLKVVTGYQEDTAYIYGTHVQVFLGNKDGTFQKEPAYKTRNVDSSHGDNGTFLLSERDGKEYIVYSWMYEIQGNAMYEYAVMCLKGTELDVVQNDHVEFVVDPFYYGYWAGQSRADLMPQIQKGLEPWIQNAVILVSYDVKTPTYLISEENQTPASTYYDSVWARNEDDRVKEFYEEVDIENSKPGVEEWEMLLFRSINFDETKPWFEKQLASDYSQWYTEYDGSELQRIDKLERHPNSVGDGGIPANHDLIYYRASEGETAQDAIYKMVEKMAIARMEPDDCRRYVITKYAIPEQELIPIADDMWLIEYVETYYAFDGWDMGTMEEHISGGTMVTEDGLIPFFAQGGPEQYYHILMLKDGVYRLERLDNMLKQQ